MGYSKEFHVYRLSWRPGDVRLSRTWWCTTDYLNKCVQNAHLKIPTVVIKDGDCRALGVSIARTQFNLDVVHMPGGLVRLIKEFRNGYRF